MKLLATYPDDLKICVADLTKTDRENLSDLGYSFIASENVGGIEIEEWQKPRVPDDKFQGYIEFLGLKDYENSSFGGRYIVAGNGLVIAQYCNEKEKWDTYKYLIGMILHTRKSAFGED